MFLRRLHPRSQQDSDHELLLAAHQGSSDAVAALYHRHGPLIYRFTLRLSHDSSIAEEITQEVFLALLRDTSRYHPERGASLSTWLCGIARRQLWRHLERNQRFVPIDTPDEPFDPPSLNEGPAEHLSRAEALAALRDGLDALPLLLKEVVILCELEELTYQQVALILAVPIGTVRSRLHRARARLAILLRNSTEKQPS